MSPFTTEESLADLLSRIGNVPPERVAVHPPLGTATEQDVIAGLEAPRRRLFELVSGALVEKAMGAKESIFGIYLAAYLVKYLDEHDIGILVGADGPFRLTSGLVRIPDVSFVSWDRVPGGHFPPDPISDLVPDLVVEVISRSNTPQEMRIKVANYFDHGVRMVWLIDPAKESAESYRSPTDRKRITKSRALDGEDVLPGFTLPLKELFSRDKRRPRKG